MPTCDIRKAAPGLIRRPGSGDLVTPISCHSYIILLLNHSGQQVSWGGLLDQYGRRRFQREVHRLAKGQLSAIPVGFLVRRFAHTALHFGDRFPVQVT